MANNKSNTKVIKIAPEVDVAASNKTKQEIKKLIEHLNFTLTGVGKGLTEHGLDSFSKYYKKAISNITKEFEKMQPEMQKHIKSGFSEVAKYLNSIQKEFTKENRNLAKEAEKNLNNIKTSLDAIGKSAEAAQRAINKLGTPSGVKILGQKRGGKGSRTYKSRQDRQSTYEDVFGSNYDEYVRNSERERRLSIIRERRAAEQLLPKNRLREEAYKLKMYNYRKLFDEAERRENERLIAEQLLPKNRLKEAAAQLKIANYTKLFDEAIAREELRKATRERVLTNLSTSRSVRPSAGFSKFLEKTEGIQERDVISVEEYNERFEKLYERLTKKGEKYLKDFSRRVNIYFSYKIIDLFTKSVGGAVDSLIKLQSSFANIQAITASTNSQMEKIRKSVFDVGVNTRFATEEIADAAVVLGQAGLSTKEISSVLEHTATLASATGEDLKNTAGLMTSVLSIWNMNADQASHVADVFVTSANDTKATLDSLSYGVQYAGTSLAQLGVSFEETSAVMAASTNAGLKSSSMLGTGMRALATELTNQSKRMKETLASLGLTFDDVDIQSLGLIKVLKNLKEAGFGATEAFAAFDRRAATYALAALSELDTAEKLTDAFNQNGAAAKANATQMATLQSQLISLQDIIAKGMNSSFRALTDLLSGLLSGVNGLLKSFDGLIIRVVSTATSIMTLVGVWKKLVAIYRSVQAYNLITYRKEAIILLKQERGEVEKLTASMIKAKAVSLAWKNVLKSLWKYLKITAVLTALSYGIDWLFYSSKKLEDQIAELNETMETHRSTMNSVASDLEELVNKESLYSDDVEILNKRIAELNRKYSDKGFVVQYAEANEDLSEKLKMVREELEAIDRIENKRRANAGYDVAKKKLEISKENASRVDSYLGNLGKSQLESFGDIARLNVFKQVDKILKSNDADKYTLAKNKVLSEYSIYKNQFKNNEEWKKILDRDIDSINEYISSHFNFVEAELDKKAAEFDNSKQALELEDKLDSVVQQETEFLKTQLEEIIKATTENGGKNLAKVKSSDVSEKMKNISEYINGPFLKQLQDIESQIPEEFRSKSKVGSSASAITNKIGRGTYTPSELSNLLKTLDSWRNKSKFGKEVSANADRLYNVINEYMLSQTKTQGTLTDKQKLRQAQAAAEAAHRTEELNKKDAEQRSTPFLDLRRNELSNIGESTKAAKKARDIRLKGFGYTTGLTSATQGLYKGYSDEMSLLESALNAERYAKILKELEKEYDYVRTKKEDLSKVEVTALDLMKDTENKLTESSEAYQILTGKTYEYGASLSDLIVKYADLRMKTEELTSASTTGWNGFLEGFKNKYKEMSEQVRKNGSISNQIGELVYTSGISGMENALISICDRTKSVSDAFREMLADILKEIRNFLIKQAVQQFFMAMGSALFSSAGTTTTLPNGTTIHTTGVETLGPGVTTQGGSISSGFVRKAAAGGVVQGGIKGRDSVHTMLMPGEYVMKKSAVDVLGTKFFNSLNTNAAQTMNTVGAMMCGTSLEGQSEPSIVNVWVVSEKDEAQMGPNDVIATISKDLQTGGTTKKLIQTIVAGRKA